MTLTRRLLAALLLVAPPALAQTTEAIIHGKVVDSQGSPVANATVTFFPFAGAIGILKVDTITGSDGSFVLRLQPFGKGIISAYKAIAGFPDAEMALYGRWAYPSVAEIDATTGADIDIDLKFNEPDALIEWTVVSRTTQRPIPRASYKIEWSDDSKVMALSTIPSDGFFRFVLPKHPVVIHIEAPGFKDWTSADASAFGQALVLKPGTVDRRSIMLDPK